MGFWLDLRLILCTAFHVVGVPYAILGRFFLLPSPERDPQPAWADKPAGS